jgi:hypothetical protein
MRCVRMRIFILLLFAFVVSVSSITEGNSNCLGMQCIGIWANGAKSPFNAHTFTPTTTISPNGDYSISGSTDGLSLISMGISSHLSILINPPLTEVLWAPDSRSFAINVSDGGLVGTWESYIYLIDDKGHPMPLDIQQLIMPIANKILKCDPKEEANIGIAAWLNGSKDVLLIAEVPPHSSCQNMGAIIGFRISIESKKIIERISEVELRKNWRHALGCRFTVNQKK